MKLQQQQQQDQKDLPLNLNCRGKGSSSLECDVVARDDLRYAHYRVDGQEVLHVIVI